MREDIIREALDEYATRHLPIGPDPWDAIRRRSRKNARRRSSLSFGSMPRRVGIVMVLGMIITFATAGALSIYIRWYEEWQPDRQQLDERGLLREIGQSRTANGYTVTLRHAFADANLVILDYTVSDAAGRIISDMRPIEMTLTDSRGIILPSVLGSRTVEVDPGVLGQVVYFDAAGLGDTPSAVNLRFSLTLATRSGGAPPVTLAVNQEPSRAMGGESQGVAATPTLITPMSYRPIAPPFTFDFTVAFEPGSRLEDPQVVTAADVPMTLRRVVNTPTESRATVCFAPPNATDRPWQVVAEVDGRVTNAASAVTGVNPESCAMLHLAPLQSTIGETLRIREITYQTTDGVRSIVGPWVFRLTAP